MWRDWGVKSGPRNSGSPISVIPARVVIALIDDPHAVRRLLEHLGRWQPEAMERPPPVPPEAWPANESFALAYHLVPDIA